MSSARVRNAMGKGASESRVHSGVVVFRMAHPEPVDAGTQGRCSLEDRSPGRVRFGVQYHAVHDGMLVKVSVHAPKVKEIESPVATRAAYIGEGEARPAQRVFQDVRRTTCAWHG